MTRQILSLLLVACLALPSFSAPARADADLDKALTALFGLAVVGAIINDSQKKRKKSAPHVEPTPKRHPNSGWKKGQAKILPKGCLQEFDTSKGKRRYFGDRCLSEHYRHADRLPTQCRTKVWTDQGKRKLYSPSCLKKAGYATKRREY
jgi:hypothetical protein